MPTLPKRVTLLGSWHLGSGISIDFTMHSNKGEQRKNAIPQLRTSGIEGEEDIFHVDGEKVYPNKSVKGIIFCH
mgnify:CR=1 FL=1